MYKLRFVWFAKDFDIENNFFIDLLRQHVGSIEVVTEPTKTCDLEIVCCFRPRGSRAKSALQNLIKNLPVGLAEPINFYPNIYTTNTKNFMRRIFYTSENLRPPMNNNFQGSLSFDQDDFNGFNAYLPSWFLDAPFLKDKYLARLGRDVSMEDIIKPRKFQKKKKKFACAFIRNPHPTRIRAIKSLEKFGEVDVFGPSVNLPVEGKYQIAKNYKFMVCFENDLFPGYVTEKLFDAFFSDTVPLYWGDPGGLSIIKPEIMLNLKDFVSLNDYANHVSQINDYQYENLYNQNFLNEIPSFKYIAEIMLGNK